MGRRRRPDRVWVRPDRTRGELRWRVESRVGGVATSTCYPTKAEADREAKIVAAAIRRGTVHAPQTWEDAVNAFLEHRQTEGDRESTRKTYGYWLKAVSRTLGEPDPLTLDVRAANKHRSAREEKGIAPTTIANELAAVVQLQRWFVSMGWVRVATWADVTRPEKIARRAHLLPHEVGTFMRTAGRLAASPPGKARPKDWERWPAAAWLLLHGLRTAELQHLLIGDIDRTQGIVYVRDRIEARTKSKSSERGVPIIAELALECLRDTYRGLPLNEPAFRTGRGDRAATGRTHWFERRCKITCCEAGITVVSPHALRHTVATAAAVAGSDMSSIQALLGHADVRVTDRTYAHAAAAAKAAGAARAIGSFLDRVVGARPDLGVVR